MPGAKTPPRMDEECFGVDLSNLPYEQIQEQKINLSYVIDAYQSFMAHNETDAPFFRAFFDKLMGQTYVREMIEQGCTNEQIRERIIRSADRYNNPDRDQYGYGIPDAYAAYKMKVTSIVETSAGNRPIKYIEGNTLYIVHNGKTYTVFGTSK